MPSKSIPFRWNNPFLFILGKAKYPDKNYHIEFQYFTITTKEARKTNNINGTVGNTGLVF